MILYRKYGKTIEITKTEKEPSSIRRISNTRSSSIFIKPRRVDSVRRTKRICMRRVLSAIEELGTPLLITLTFQGSASDILFSSKALTRFQRRLQIQFPNSCSLFVPELAPEREYLKNGEIKFHGLRIHFHGLLFGVSEEWGDTKSGRITVAYGREREDRLFKKLWGYGYVDIIKTDGSIRLAGYIGKYISKSTHEEFLTPLRLIRTSRNFPKPIEYRFENNSEVDYLFSRMKLKPVWEGSHYTSFMGMVTKTFYDIL